MVDMVVGFVYSEEDDSYARGSTLLDRRHQMSQTKSVFPIKKYGET